MLIKIRYNGKRDSKAIVLSNHQRKVFHKDKRVLVLEESDAYMLLKNNVRISFSLWELNVVGVVKSKAEQKLEVSAKEPEPKEKKPEDKLQDGAPAEKPEEKKTEEGQPGKPEESKKEKGKRKGRSKGKSKSKKKS